MPMNDTTDLYGKEIKPVAAKAPEVGINTDNAFIYDVLGSIESSTLDIGKLNQFTSISTSRDMLYAQIDSMAQDPIIQAALDIYAEDTTERSAQGDIVWVESSDENIRKMVQYLLDSFRINKYIYKWAYSLVLYGDIYIRLFRKSMIEDAQSERTINPDNIDTKKPLNEQLVLQLYNKTDDYISFVEMVPNPAEMYELTQFGKTQGYIQAPVVSPIPLGDNSIYNNPALNSEYTYRYANQDVNIYQATEFVHGCLEDVGNRYPEKILLFQQNEDLEEMSIDDSLAKTYTVKRGKPLLQNVFKLWRSLKLLEDSLILNRLSKSSIVRLVKIEVGDMPKEQVKKHLLRVKQMIEQKTAIEESVSMSEYNGPGPIDNSVYIPTHGGVGNIDVAELGQSPDIKAIVDIDYFKEKLYAALGIPKTFLGDTDDSAGFNGGSSLAQISSRYAKRIRKLQGVLIEVITDIINIILISRGMGNSVNKFTIRMQPPTTAEEIARNESISGCISRTRDIMDLLVDIDNPITKLKVLKTSLGSGYINSDILSIIQDEIDKLIEESKLSKTKTSGDELGDFGGESESGGDALAGFDNMFGGGGEESSEETVAQSDEELPSMSDSDMDFTNSEENFEQ